jgi:two-component system, NtrC family, sensor kinase
MKFFRRYNQIMIVTYFVVIFIFLILVFVQTRSSYDNTIKLMKENFRETKTGIDHYLKNSTDHIQSMKMQADMFFSNQPDDPTSYSLFNSIKDVPEKKYFSMNSIEPDGSPNLTGKGSIKNRDTDFYMETRLALELAHQFRIIKESLPQIPWIYYTSRYDFLCLYPFAHSDDFHFNDSTHDMEFYKSGLPEKNPGRKNFWTKAYIDEVGKGLMVTCSGPVYNKNCFHGTVSLDFTLETLNRFIAQFPHSHATIFLLSNRNELLAHPTLIRLKDTKLLSIKDAFPKKIDESIESFFQINPMEKKIIAGNVFFYQNLKNAPWRLVFLTSEKRVFLTGLMESGFMLIALFAGLTLMLIISAYITRKEFITPAQQLVSHIEKSSLCAETKEPEVPETWKPWFDTITKIFCENRNLLEELKKHNEDLDALVSERTSELKQKNDELEQTFQQMKEMQEQIIMQEKMASLGALTAGIAHEIKNPLNFVNNFAEMSEELFKELKEILLNNKIITDSPQNDEITEVIGFLEQNVIKIKEHGKRADRIVRSMLLHSRGKAGEREKVDFNKLVDEYVKLAYHGLRGQDSTFNITIKNDYDEKAGLVNLVPQDFGRAILNIVQNAFYSCNEKKKENAGKSYSPTLKVTTRNIENAVELHLHDNGKGIPAQKLEKIFTPFFTTKPAGSGTGLGLSITYDIIVREHNGEINVKSIEGEYAEFLISLPKEI